MLEGPTLLGLLLGLALLGVLFGLIERWGGLRNGSAWYRRRDVRTDLAYGLFTPFVTRLVTGFAVALVVAGLVLLTGRSLSAFQAEVAAGRFPDLSLWGLGAWMRGLSLGVQLALGLVVADFLGYWTHRLFHGRRLWRFHAVHHSSTDLDWLSSLRVHPINDLLSRVLQTAPLLLLGFDPLVFAVVAPFLSFYGILLHAKVSWSFGPLRTVLASPAFHRWHHAADLEARDKNLAGLFPVWDLLFGTWWMPEDRHPVAFGAPNDPIPQRFLGQLVYPLRRHSPRALATSSHSE